MIHGLLKEYLCIEKVAKRFCRTAYSAGDMKLEGRMNASANVMLKLQSVYERDQTKPNPLFACMHASIVKC